MRIGLGIGVGSGGKPAPGSEAAFTSGPTISETTSPLTVVPGVNTLSVTGISGFPIAADTPSPNTLIAEVAFP